MFMLFLMLPFWGLEIVAPAILWILAPGWHRLLTGTYAAIALVLLVVWVRDLRREYAEHRLIAATHATWRWSRRATPDAYRARLAMFLSLRGWHVDASSVTPRGRVELLARKDRRSVLLLCVGPRQEPADSLDLQHAADVRVQTRATYAAVVSRAPIAAESGPRSNVEQFRFSDLTRLEQKAPGYV
jgi:hypothetical protein